jgi:HSP20 family protein
MTLIVKRSPDRELAPWTRYSPLREFRAMEERMERLFGDLFPRWAGPAEVAPWEPAIEVYENDKEFVLKAELPEISEKDVRVSLDGGVLTISGERKEEKEIKKDKYYRTERFYGTFTRSFTLPPSVDAEGIKATFRDGVMKLTMPKKETAKPKEIKIEAGK